MLPELDGYEVLEELRHDSATAAIPFIFLTARVERDDMRKGMELGADDYITKPYTRRELLAAVRARLDKQNALEKQRLRMLSHRLDEAQEAERRRIAHELHNEVGQILTGLKVILGLSKRLSMETIKFKLDEAQELVDELIARVSELSLDLRPPLLDDLGLLPALLQFFNRYTSQTRVNVDFRHAGLERRFSPNIEVAVYRIIQEASSNIARHAAVGQATVQVWTDQNALHVQIEDQGAGFHFESVASTNRADGLMNMHERVMALGGQFSITSAPGMGTSVIARLPIDEGGEAILSTATKVMREVLQ
jgi:signal transduction histidine kinase